MTLTVPCLFGLESLVADEMRRLNLGGVRAENGRVHCEGTMVDIARSKKPSSSATASATLR